MSSTLGGTCYKAIDSFFGYDTVHIVHFKNKKVGILLRCLQLVVLAYIFGYVIGYKKGYQATDVAESSTTSKLKGIASTNYTALNMSGPDGIDYRIWDVADYSHAIPPQENDAFFVMTNAIVTEGQTQGLCAEDSDLPRAVCKSEADCRKGETVHYGNGIMTGRCIQASDNPSLKSCEIHAWCPVEIDTPPIYAMPLLNGSEDFTVYIKNNIAFKDFDTKRRNIIQKLDKTYVQSCRFNASDPDDKYCPVFRIGDIVALAGVKNFSSIAALGGVIVFNIKWECNLDYSADECLPEYSFRRFDIENIKIEKGTSFRFANFYHKNETMQRDLIRAYGILFLIKVTGEAGKFNVIPLFLNIGSGVGLLAGATVICDIVLCYILRHEVKDFYVSNKYKYADEQYVFPDPNAFGDATLLPSDVKTDV